MNEIEKKRLRLKYTLNRIDRFRTWDQYGSAYECITEHKVSTAERIVAIMHELSETLPREFYITYNSKLVVQYARVTFAISDSRVAVHILAKVAKTYKTSALEKLYKYIRENFNDRHST